jgi:hypothetical protein
MGGENPCNVVGIVLNTTLNPKRLPTANVTTSIVLGLVNF